MATVQERNGSYRVLFVYGGRRETFTLGKVSKAVAEGKATKVEELLGLLKRGVLAVPAGVPIVEFMQADGKAVARGGPPRRRNGSASASSATATWPPTGRRSKGTPSA